LEFAGQIYPSLVVPTIERYWNKLHEKSGIENPNTVGRGLEGTITASGRPTKKKLMLPRNTPTTVHNETEVQDVSNDRRYMQALVVMRDFLRTGNPKASHLKSIPKELTKADAVTTQVSNHWLPAINFYFGSVECFLFHLSKADAVKQALHHLVASGRVDDIVKTNVERFLQPALIGWRDRLQEALYKKGVEVQKGTQISAQSLQNLDTVLNKESKT